MLNVDYVIKIKFKLNKWSNHQKTSNYSHLSLFQNCAQRYRMQAVSSLYYHLHSSTIKHVPYVNISAEQEEHLANLMEQAWDNSSSNYYAIEMIK